MAVVASVRIIGPGRAGRSLAGALAAVGWVVEPLLGRGDDLAGAAQGVEVLVVATPDAAVAEVAASVRPVATTVVLHLSGSLGTDAVGTHSRRGCLHPLVPLPDPATGSERLRSGVTFAVAGDPMASELAEALGGRAVEVPDAARPLYHAAATVAANHLVAVLGQVARLAGDPRLAGGPGSGSALAGGPGSGSTLAGGPGLGLADFLPLARAALDDVARAGPAAALTGPVARGDWATVSAHLDALSPDEHAGYLGGVALALRLLADRR